MPGHTILVVDDEADTLRMITRNLEQAGFRVIQAASGQEALRQMYDNRPDLLVLDVDLSKSGSRMDGITVCQRIREVSTVPIIMVTAKTAPEDIVVGLEAGADDYVNKPFNKDVLIARIRANLRRAANEPTYEKSGVIYSDSYLTINLDERRVTRDGIQVKLSPTEFNMLAKLIQSSPRVVAYRDLLESVWGYEYIDDIDYLRVYMWHLRRKVEKDARAPVYLINELGVGYRFEKQI